MRMLKTDAEVKELLKKFFHFLFVHNEYSHRYIVTPEPLVSHWCLCLKDKQRS